MDRTEQAWLEALSRGDAEAFRRVFELYWKRVHGVCRRHVGNDEDARELTQELFKNLWEKREALRIEGPLENYLMRAAKYAVFNHHRGLALRERKLERLREEFRKKPVDPEAERMREEFRAEADRRIEALPDAARTVFKLSHHGGLPHREIARILSISTKTVEYHLRSARTRLRRDIGPESDLST